jgi:hypothetical protein
MNKTLILPMISGLALIALSASTVVSSETKTEKALKFQRSMTNGKFTISGLSVATYSYGVQEATNSPYDGYNCSSCHSGGIAPTVSLSAHPAFGAGNTYIPNTTYTITLKATGNVTYGFDMEILNSQSATSVGDFGTFVSCPSNETINPPPGAGAPSDVMHNTPISSGIMTLVWKAPASGTGYIYYAVLGANGNNNQSGDKVKNGSMTLIDSPTGIEANFLSTANLSVFPNPATDNVRVTYTLSERGQVSVKLYNLRGELVADMLNENQNPGMQAMDLRLPANLAKGMYMVRLSVDGKQTTQKLMVN